MSSNKIFSPFHQVELTDLDDKNDDDIQVIQFSESLEDSQLTTIEVDDDIDVTKHIGTYNPYSIVSLGRWALNFHRRKVIGFCFFVFIIIPVIIIIVTTSGTSQQSSENNTPDIIIERNPFDKYSATSSSGIVVTDHEDCSNIGAKILRDGGNAVDATIASTLCLGVVSPGSSGIGGGCFMLHFDYDSQFSTFIDGREIAPAAADTNMYNNDTTLAEDGALAIGVPGELKALYKAYQQYGSGDISWYNLVFPAATLAKSWIISDSVAKMLESMWDTMNSDTYSALRALYGKQVDGIWEMKKSGDTVEQPSLHYFLDLIGDQGPIIMYGDSQRPYESGTLADEIQAAGGIITQTDLNNMDATERDVIKVNNILGLEWQYLGAPPPSSGGAAVVAILEFMSAYLLNTSSPLTIQEMRADSKYSHRLAEAMKHAFALRMALGDPSFVNTTELQKTVDAMLNKDDYMHILQANTSDDVTLERPELYGGPLSGYAAADRRRNLRSSPPLSSFDNNLKIFESQNIKEKVEEEDEIIRFMRGSILPIDHGTSHVSVLDKDGNAVALTSTINTEFGSKFVSPSTGIVFNNQMDDFSIPGEPNHYSLAPSEANYIKPGKKPLSSMSPSILLGPSVNGKRNVMLVGGASGGPHIITATAQVILNYASGYNLSQSVYEPREHHQLLPLRLDLENKTVHWPTATIIDPGDSGILPIQTDPSSIVDLTSRMHEIHISNSSFGVTQFIVANTDGTYTGTADPRKDGRAIPA